MGIVGSIIGGLVRRNHKTTGFWAYLTERTKAKRDIDLEHARNAGTAQVIMLVPEHSRFAEFEEGGRSRVFDRTSRPDSGADGSGMPTPSHRAPRVDGAALPPADRSTGVIPRSDRRNELPAGDTTR